MLLPVSLGINLVYTGFYAIVIPGLTGDLKTCPHE